jgi:predicted Ser/Thr protein kinase
MDDLTGQQLGPYQIVAPLGEGGMAAVYKAFQPSVNRHVALKVLPQYFARDPQFVARFEREAQVLAQLQHPNVLPIFDYGQSQGHTYIAMPLISGGSLEALMQRQRLDFKTIRKIVNQVGDALDYAHSRNLIHRDVKPANILIDERGNCLLTDFGLAKIVEGTAKLTSSGTIMGTPAYMSPEQGKGWMLDRRTDIYSLGVILYEMAVGRAPFEADTPMVVVVKHINDPLPRPTSLVPNFPPALEDVIVKALEKDPKDRYQTAGEFVEAFNAALDEIGGPGRAASSTDRPAGPVAAVPAGVSPSVVAASPRIDTAVPARSSKPNLVQRAWWVIPIIGVILIFGVGVIAVAGLIIFNAMKKTPTAVVFSATALPPATDPTREFQQLPPEEPNTDLTPIAPPGESDLLVEDFEDEEAADWQTLLGTATIVTLDDGNHVYELKSDQFGGAQIVYTPSWDWSPDEGLGFEADVRVEGVQLFASAVRLQVRTQAPTAEEACLSYIAELGAGWTGISYQSAADNNCSQNSWDSVSLAPQQGFEMVAGEWHHLKVLVSATQVQYYLDDNLIASANDIRNLYLGGGIGVYTGGTSQAYIDNLHAFSLNGQSPVSDESNWNVIYYHAFEPNFWPVGSHTYTLSYDCATLPAGPDAFSQGFEVSDSIDNPGDGTYYFFRDDGVFDDFYDGSAIDPVHPHANTIAILRYGGLSFADANLALTDCTGAVGWDDGQTESLEPLIMFQY